MTTRDYKCRNSKNCLEIDGSREEPQIYFANDLIAIYTAFRDEVYKPQSVLYPSSGFDASPAKVFDNVTFVDIEKGNEGCVRKLQEAGLHAIKQDIKDYTPENLHDLLILLNPAIPTEWASRHLKVGGYVLANDYHGNASEMSRKPDQFTLWGVIDCDIMGDNKIVVSRNLEGLFQPVSDINEFQKLRPDEFEFTREYVLSFASQRNLKINPNASFEEKWRLYREAMHEEMPYKRVADRYIFVKK